MESGLVDIFAFIGSSKAADALVKALSPLRSKTMSPVSRGSIFLPICFICHSFMFSKLLRRHWKAEMG